MKENLMAPFISGPKMKMMEQKAFWMHVKMFSTFMMSKMNPGFIAFKAVDRKKRRRQRTLKQGPWQTPRWKKFFKSRHEKKAHCQDEHCQEDRSWQAEES